MHGWERCQIPPDPEVSLLMRVVEILPVPVALTVCAAVDTESVTVTAGDFSFARRTDP
jgi:methylglyoxal synthase